MSELEITNRLIDEIQRAVANEVLDLTPGQYTTQPTFRIEERPLTDCLIVASLTGLVDYFDNNLDDEARKKTFIHVSGPVDVVAWDPVDTNIARRFSPIAAKADTPTLIFDRFIPKEEMIVMLQSRFAPSEDLEALIASLGTIVAEESLTVEDDGVSQGITTQKGVRRQQVAVTNPAHLRPFRTFTEIEQPESPFTVRLRKNEDDEDNPQILVALFEADGGAWRNAARQSIKEFLGREIPAISIIA